MKQVSYKVAKVLKEVGYPQEDRDNGYVVSNNIKWWKFDDSSYSDSATISGVKIAKNNLVGLLVKDIPWQDRGGCQYYTYETISAPTYLEVWLWLWREKGKDNSLYYDRDFKRWNCWIYGVDEPKQAIDPEEAIIAAIEYLVDNNNLI